MAVVCRSQDFVFHGGFGDGGTEVVFGFDLGGDGFAEGHRFGGGINRHFVFWLFVFFDPERSTLLQIVHDQ